MGEATEHIFSELIKTDSKRNFDSVLEKYFSGQKERACDYLWKLMDEKEIAVKDLSLRAGRMNPNYIYKILDGTKSNPSRRMWLRIICGLGLNLEEASRLLKLAGYKELYAKEEMDAVIILGLNNHMSFDEIDKLLVKRNTNYSLYCDGKGSSK